MAELKYETVDEAMDASVSNAKFDISATKEVNSRLVEKLQKEGARSTVFEENLKRAMDGEPFVQSGEMDEEEEMHSQMVSPRSVYIPVVSYVSPALGLVAGSSSLQQRIDFLHVGRTTRSKRPRSSNMTQEGDEEYAPSYKHSKSHIVQALSDRVSAELNASELFEQRLLAQLEQ